jgi:CRP-like cAMP-binding protein
MPSTGNLLLDRMSPRELRRLEPYLHPVEMRAGTELHDRFAEDGYVYFPLNSATSLVVTQPDGATVEVATVGREGMVGLPLFVESEAVTIEAFTHVTGDALRLKRSVLRREVARELDLCHRLHEYTEALLLFISQTCLCNSLHTQRQRLARWLLLIHDRVATDDLELTQAFLAGMLGVRRATVTITAGEFRRENLISYRKGRVRILDRKGLEAASCACYDAVRQEFDSMEAPPRTPRRR